MLCLARGSGVSFKERAFSVTLWSFPVLGMNFYELEVRVQYFGRLFFAATWMRGIRSLRGAGERKHVYLGALF